MAKLEVGEKYLNIVLNGHNPVTAFKNKDKKKENSPDYTGNGVSVWINTKKAETEKEAKVEDVL